MSVLTPLPGAQPRDCSWLRGAAGRVRLQDALRTQLQLLLAKKGRVTAGQLDPPHACRVTRPVCAAPALPARRPAPLSVELQHSHLLVAVVRPQRVPSSGLHVGPGAATQRCAMRGAEGAPCPKGAHAWSSRWSPQSGSQACVCTGLGGQKHPVALDGSRGFECVSVGSWKLLFHNPSGYLCGRGHFFFPLLILCFRLSSRPF